MLPCINPFPDCMLVRFDHELVVSGSIAVIYEVFNGFRVITHSNTVSGRIDDQKK